MKKIILSLLMVAWCGVAQAQCVPEFKGAEFDELRGSVKVLTQYVFNGQAVDVSGKPCNNCVYTSGRYDESQGTLEEILELNDYDTKMQCENLIKNNLTIEKKDAIALEKLQERKKQNTVLKDEFLKKVGEKKVISSVSETYKKKEFILNADGTYIIVDIP